MPLPGYAGAFASRRSPSAAHRVIYRAFCQSDVSSRNAASPFASEAPSDPKDRADWRTTTASRVIDQSNRPGSFAEGVTRSVWGFGLKVIMNSMWGQTEPPVRGRETIRPRGTSRCYPSLVIGRGDAARGTAETPAGPEDPPTIAAGVADRDGLEAQRRRSSGAVFRCGPVGAVATSSHLEHKGRAFLIGPDGRSTGSRRLPPPTYSVRRSEPHLALPSRRAGLARPPGSQAPECRLRAIKG